jgi:NAD(P)-dependent dehydrogenase (short-subunit alcohol dehydrogenase family)
MQKEEKYWALIVGGGSGLGLASALQLARDGYHIAIVHRTRRALLPDLEDTIAKMKEAGADVLSYNKDGLTQENIDMVITDLPQGRVKVLIHSIAKGSLRSMTGEDNEALTATDLSITLQAMGYNWYEWVRSLFKEGRFAEDTRNMAFTSEGNLKVWPGYGAVSAAKAVLESTMRQMAVEFAPSGIRTNCIQAGVTKTDSFKMIPGSEQLAALAAKRNPFGRLTTPQDIANVVSLLASDKAGWINGSIIKADGGEQLR